MKIEGKLTREKGEKYWGADIPDIGVFTQGKTKKDACNMAKEAVELLVGQNGFSVEIELSKDGTFFIDSNDIGSIIALLLKQKRLESGLSVREVAKRLGQSSSPNAYSRYETGRSTPSLAKFDEILAAINPNASGLLKII